MRQAHPPRQRPLALKPVAAACAVTLGLCAPAAMAQQAAQAPQQAASAPEPSVLDTVVVTGIRQSMASSLNLKRDSHGVVDGIVAEDIGKFPDTNLAESMQRIAGVSIDRNASGEGAQVTVRGVGPDYNMTLLNGRQMPTNDISDINLGITGSRSFDFSNLSSDSIAGVEVFKTSRANLPAGGIGATINIRTARPLDMKERVAAISIKANDDASNGRLPTAMQGNKVTPDVSGIYSETFAGGTFGIAISGSYSKRDSGQNKAYTQGGWRTFKASDTADWGTIPPAPTSGTDPVTNRPTGNMLYSTSVDMRYSMTAIERTRENGQLTLQYAPSKNLKFTFDETVAANTLNEKNAEDSSWFNFSFGGPLTFVGSPVATPVVQTALFPNNDHDYAINTGVYGQKYRLNSTGLNVEWKAADNLDVVFDGHHSNGKTSPNSPYGTYSTMDLGMFAQGTAVAYYDQKLPILSLPTTVYGAQHLELEGSQFINKLSDQTVDQFQTGATYKMGADDKLNAGLGFTNVKNRSAQSSNQNNDWGGIGAQGDYANVPVNMSSLGGYYSQIPGHNDPRLYSTFYQADFNALHAQAIQIAMQYGTQTHPAPLTAAQAQAYFSAPADYASGVGGNADWRTTEKSTSAYAQWEHSFDTTIPQNLSAGLRYESSKVDSSSQVTSYTGSIWSSQNEVDLTGGSNTFGSATGKYTYWLPSVDWDADISDKFKVRASFGETIGRPTWDQLQGGLSLSSSGNAGGGSGSAGNPALKPMLSKNLDFSAEYYYAKSSYVALSPFYKQISDFVGTSTVNITVPGLTTPIGGAYYKAAQAACGANAQPLCIRNYIFNTYAGRPGVTVVNASGNEILGSITGQPGDPLMNFVVTEPSNEKGDHINGVEFNFQHMFGRSGFGVAGNYTWVKTGLKYDNTNLNSQSALVGVSNSANLVGFYEDEAWSVRAAYNWRGEFLASKTDGAGNNPIYTEPYGQVDMSINYKLGKNLTIQADLLNLNDGYIRQHGRAYDQLVSVWQTGRRYLVGARYKF